MIWACCSNLGDGRKCEYCWILLQLWMSYLTYMLAMAFLWTDHSQFLPLWLELCVHVPSCKCQPCWYVHLTPTWNTQNRLQESDLSDAARVHCDPKANTTKVYHFRLLSSPNHQILLHLLNKEWVESQRELSWEVTLIIMQAEESPWVNVWEKQNVWR